MVTFLRRSWTKYSKLGRRRKNKQTWRKPTGRDNKMREKRRGYPLTVSIGYGTDKKERGLLKEKSPVRIENVKDLEKMGKNNIGILSNVGKKKRIEIARKAEEKKIEFSNFNASKFLKSLKKENKK